MRIPYHELESRLNKLRWGRLCRIGQASGYPLYAWKHSPSTPQGHLLVSAGIHGDEPAGVAALLHLLERPPIWLKRQALSIFPCLNPWGYEHNRRQNKKGQDMNRLWKNKRSPALAPFLPLLGSRKFDMTLCLHEDYDANGFYLYELTRHDSLIGPSIIRSVKTILPIDSRPKIEGRTTQGGLITRSAESILRRKQWPEALYHYQFHTDHTMTTETPTSLPMEKRMMAHIEAIRLAALKKT